MLGSGRHPGGENGTQSSILPWEIPGTEEPVLGQRLQSMGLQKRCIHLSTKPTHITVPKQDYTLLSAKTKVDLPNPGNRPRPPALQAVSLPAETQGNSRNTGVRSLSILQGIFLTQESNQGLLYFRGILYQRSYQGNPKIIQCRGQ